MCEKPPSCVVMGVRKDKGLHKFIFVDSVHVVWLGPCWLRDLSWTYEVYTLTWVSVWKNGVNGNVASLSRQNFVMSIQESSPLSSRNQSSSWGPILIGTMILITSHFNCSFLFTLELKTKKVSWHCWSRPYRNLVTTILEFWYSIDCQWGLDWQWVPLLYMPIQILRCLACLS